MFQMHLQHFFSSSFSETLKYCSYFQKEPQFFSASSYIALAATFICVVVFGSILFIFFSSLHFLFAPTFCAFSFHHHVPSLFYHTILMLHFITCFSNTILKWFSQIWSLSISSQIVCSKLLRKSLSLTFLCCLLHYFLSFFICICNFKCMLQIWNSLHQFLFLSDLLSFIFSESVCNFFFYFLRLRICNT